MTWRCDRKWRFNSTALQSLSVQVAVPKWRDGFLAMRNGVVCYYVEPLNSGVNNFTGCLLLFAPLHIHIWKANWNFKGINCMIFPKQTRSSFHVAFTSISTFNTWAYFNACGNRILESFFYHDVIRSFLFDIKIWEVKKFFFCVAKLHFDKFPYMRIIQWVEAS